MTRKMLTAVGLAVGSLFWASAASANVITLDASTSGDFTASCSSATQCAVTSNGSVSGPTSTGGTYTFTGMNAVLDTCSAGTGCATFVSGSRGTVTVDGTTYTLTSLTLDGDGTGVDFIFSAAGLLAPNDATLNTATTFNTLLSTSGTTGLVALSSGEVNVPGPIVGAGLPGLVAACGGLFALARRRRKQVA